LDEGGLIYEDYECDSFADAMQALQTGLGVWFKEQDR
jgi:predicted sugar kinase